MASQKSREPGWYGDGNDPEAERYWDGTRWRGRRMFHLYNMPPVEPPKPDACDSWFAIWLVITMAAVVAVGIAVMLLAGVPDG
jgi:hypothetical protein